MKEPIIGYSSDIHLNLNLPEKNRNRHIRKFAVHVADKLNKEKVDYYIINGDISYNLNEVDLFINTIKKFLKRSCKITTTIGNHENSKHFTLKQYLYDKLSENYLPHEPIITPTRAVFGLNGFSDTSFLENKFATKYNIEDTLNERYFIKNNNMSLSDFNSIIDVQLSELEKVMENHKKEIEGKELFLVTHYIPKVELKDSADTVKKEFQNIFGGSIKTGKFLEDNNFSHCYYGHSHKRIEREHNKKYIEINGVKYSNSPLSPHYSNVEHGYITEDTPKDLDYIIEMFEQSFRII